MDIIGGEEEYERQKLTIELSCPHCFSFHIDKRHIDNKLYTCLRCGRVFSIKKISIQTEKEE